MGSLGASYNSEWNQNLNLGLHLEGYNFSENNWEHYKKKVGEIKQLLFHHSSLDEKIDQKESLILVDAIQRVGLDHHFEEEIETILRSKYFAASIEVDDLYDVSLYFRLLRNQGYYVSQDLFNDFRGNDGKFKEKFKQDVKGLMELHEAAQLRFRDEDIIDEAEEFSRENLNKCLEDMNVGDWDKTMIRNTLRYPKHKNISRLSARKYTDGGSFKGCEKGWEITLVELARVDDSMEELLHKEELLHIYRWWENIGVAKELELARSQPVKWYIWSMAMLNNPSMSFERIELTKAIAFVYLIDDIFDLYGNIHDLTLFTQAIDRWEYGAVHTLPEYMRKSYIALLDTINGIAQRVEEKYNTNPIDSLKASWGSLCDAFMVEARWFSSKELPKAEEYLKNGAASSGVHVVLVHLLFLLGLGRGQYSIHLNDYSTLISSIATILCLTDDLGSAKDERQDGSDGSYIKCCTNEDTSLSIEEVRRHVDNLISNGWQIINEECFQRSRLDHSSISCFTRACLNFARMIPLMYTYDENQRLPLLEEHIDMNSWLDVD